MFFLSKSYKFFCEEIQKKQFSRHLARRQCEVSPHHCPAKTSSCPSLCQPAHLLRRWQSDFKQKPPKIISTLLPSKFVSSNLFVNQINTYIFPKKYIIIWGVSSVHYNSTGRGKKLQDRIIINLRISRATPTPMSTRAMSSSSLWDSLLRASLLNLLQREVRDKRRRRSWCQQYSCTTTTTTTIQEGSPNCLTDERAVSGLG